jgi:hypothetical protein
VNVVTAAPAASPRAPRTASAAPAQGDGFAALLAGLASREPTATAGPEGPVDVPTDAAPQDGADQGQPGSDVVPLVLPLPLPAPVHAAAAAEAPVADPALPTASAGAWPPVTAGAAVDADGGPSAPAPATAAAQAGTGLADVPVPALPAPATGTLDLRSAPGTPAAVPQLLAAQAVTSGDAPVGRPTVGPTTAPAPGAPLVPDPAPTALTQPSAPALVPATTSAPDAVELSVPADAAGDSPVPVLDVRSTASPAAPLAAAQTAGTAVVEAMLPADTAIAVPAGPVDVPVDAALPEAAPAVPVAAPAGAEAGVAGPQPADLRTSAPATPAAAPAPAPPAAQVAQLLGPVLEGPDGTYSLSLQLYPEELGAVQVEVLLRGGEIRLALHAPDEAAQAALRSALPDLRADLLAGGLSATSLSVDDGRPGSSSDRSTDRSPDRRSDGQGDAPGRRSHPYRDADPGPRQLPSHADAALDLRM